MKEKFPEDNAERSEEFAMERAKEFLPSLRRFHDLFEDRSIMANKAIADYLASQFTTAGVEVFSDFVDDLKKAKARQIKMNNPQEK